MTPKQLRCATYARYSSDQQRESSIVDQQRNMARYAESREWRILPEFVFSDQAMSGAGADRPGLQALLSAALTKPKPFDVILIDDSSRVSRSLADIIRIREQLSFAGVRLVAVSQGIDSADEQADVMLTVHGLVDSLYIKELSKKTHRGLEGLALQGLHTGGNCFGYRNVRVGEHVRLEIEENQAVTVVRIFKMASEGMSLKRIAKTLNREGVAPPRGSKRKVRPNWVYTAVREMLRRELYVGRLIWNKRKYVKRPGTNKRVSVSRPEQEWTIVDAPELRIIQPELWETVQSVITRKREQYSLGHPGFMNRAVRSRYIFSGLLKCAECGSNLTILSARGRDRRVGYYGCPGHLHRGICSNNVYVRRDILEQRLLQGIQAELQEDAALSYVLRHVRRTLEAEDRNCDVERDCKRRDDLRQELSRLADAIAQAGGSDFLLAALKEKEVQLQAVCARIASAEGADIRLMLNGSRIASPRNLSFCPRFSAAILNASGLFCCLA